VYYFYVYFCQLPSQIIELNCSWKFKAYWFSFLDQNWTDRISLLNTHLVVWRHSSKRLWRVNRESNFWFDMVVMTSAAAAS